MIRFWALQINRFIALDGRAYIQKKKKKSKNKIKDPPGPKELILNA